MGVGRFHQENDGVFSYSRMNSFDDTLNQRLEAWREQGLRRELRRVDSAQGPRIKIDGRAFLNFSSNDYLGLANHPALKEAAIKAIETIWRRLRRVPADLRLAGAVS